MAAYTPTYTYTDNPFVDLLLYNCKIMAFGAVIKNEDNALDAETTQSLELGDLLIACEEKSVTFSVFWQHGYFSVNDYAEAGITPITRIKSYMESENNIGLRTMEKDVTYYPELVNQMASMTEKARLKFLDEYTEFNNYYRMLCGLPDIGDYGVPIRDYEYLINEVTGYTGNEGNIWGAVYVHDIPTDGCIELENAGIMEQIRNDYPQYKYLQYSACGITPYSARKAYDFQLLYVPDIEDKIIQDRFKDRYEDNRTYVMNAFYTDAFNLTSPYYSNFIELLIVLLTLTDILSEVQSDIIKKDILDRRCVQYIFEMYGIPYYKSIPLIYQKRICKNLNLLIRDKSSAQCMFDIIDLFGAENVEVFKYYILRDRTLDAWGNYAYNTISTTTTQVNDILIQSTSHVALGSKTSTTIPYPFEYYLEKGNKMVVRAGNKILTENTDYTIRGDTITFTASAIKDSKDIYFDFYYDSRTKEGYVTANDDSSIIVEYQKCYPRVKNKKEYIEYRLPYPSYLLDGNDILILRNGWITHSTIIDTSNNTITWDSDKDYLLTGTTMSENSEVYLVYIYSKTHKIRFKHSVVVFETNKYTATITEPFDNYLSKGNSMVVIDNSLLVDPSYYTLNENTINLSKSYEPWRTKSDPRFWIVLDPLFVYSSDSIYMPLELNTETEVITATNPFQTDFEIHPPIDNYAGSGYKFYVKLRGEWLEENLYDLYYHTISLREMSMGLNPGETIEIMYVYGTYDDTNKLGNNVIERFYLQATTDKQNVFTDVPYSTYGYYGSEECIVVDSYGVYMEKDKDYTIDTAKKTLTITNKNLYPKLGRKINVTIVHKNLDISSAQTSYSTITATSDNQTEFTIDLPFYPYFESKNSVLVFHNKLNSNGYYYNQIVRPYWVSGSGRTLTIYKSQGIKKGDKITIVFLYDEDHYLQKNGIMNTKNAHIDLTDNIAMDNPWIDLPAPSDDYFENGWLYYVSSNGVFIPETDYTILNNKLAFNTLNDYAKYVDNGIDVTFIYSGDSNYSEEVISEDIEKNLDLRFVAAPINKDDWYHNNHIMNNEISKAYNNMVIEDPFWHGVDSGDSEDSLYYSVRKKILESGFNYQRTKYFGLAKVYDIAEASFQLAYFYNMLFDDVKIERLLNIKVNKISADGTFNIVHIFCYLIALSYMYNDIDDTIMDTPTKILYVKGFNFKTDIETLRQDILDQYKDPDDYPIWEWMDPNPNQIKDMNELNEIYKKNKEIYEIVTDGMFNARNHDIYKVWKKIYDSLMIWKFNLDYFKLNDGTQASTYTEFLEEKSPVLYETLMKFKANEDIESRNNAIVEQIIDVVYIVKQYLDEASTYHIFKDMPGVSEDAILDYIYTLVDFFKSYKIMLVPKMIFMQFGANSGNDGAGYGTKWLNSMRPTDDKEIQCLLPRYLYLDLDEKTSKYNNIFLSDSVGIKEALSIETTTKEKDNVPIHIKQISNQTITVYNNGKAYTSDFEAPYESDFYCYIDAEEGFTPGNLNIKQGVAIEETTIYASTSSGKILEVQVIQSDHQTITVWYNGIGYTSNFNVKYGSTITTFIEAEVGYNAGTLNYGTVNVVTSIIVQASAAIKDKYTVFVKETDNQTIKFTTKDLVINEGETGSVAYNTDYVATITADEEWYTPGELNIPDSGSVTSNLIVYATDATVKQCTVEIIQPSYSTLTVYINGSETGHTENIFSVDYGSTYRITLEADIGYDVGTISCNETGTITDDMVITASDAIKKEDLTIYIVQSLNQIITVYVDGVAYTREDGITVPYGSAYTAVVTPNDGYTAGELINGSSDSLTENVVVSAEPAEQMMVTVTIGQQDYQQIQVTCETFVFTSTFSMPYGSEWSAIVVSTDESYAPGELNTVSSGILTSDFTISASAPTLRAYPVTIEQSDNQTITVTCGDNIYTSSFTAIIGSTWTATITANEYYNAGTLSATSGTIDGPITISASAATKKQVTITITQSANQTIHVYTPQKSGGTDHTSTFKIDAGTAYEAEVIANSGYTAGTLNVSGGGD